MALPPDIDPESRSRLPLVRREELDAGGQAVYDRVASDPRSLVGLRGPGGLRLHSPALSTATRQLGHYLRFDAGLDRRLAELAILATARETDQRFEWHAHEPAALREGLEPEIVDVVRYNRPLTGLGEKEAALIALVREAIGARHVTPETYAAAHRAFGTETLLHFVELIGNYAATAILLTVFDQHLPSGAASALPVPKPNG